MSRTPSATADKILPYEHIMTFDQPEQPIPMGPSSPFTNSGGSGSRSVIKTSIRSDDALSLRGPIEVDGSIGSMASVTFSGDFVVNGQIEA